MASVDEQVVYLATIDGRLRVEFHWQQDRFMHRVLLDQVEVGRSIEGDATELWPTSGPMQQLSLEPILGADAILGVGSAGRTHWSLSLQLEQGDDQAPAFRFEWAARYRDLPSSLGSAYSLANQIEIRAADGPAIKESAEVDGWRELSVGGLENGSAATPAVTSGSRASTTHRWSYRISLRG